MNDSELSGKSGDASNTQKLTVRDLLARDPYERHNALAPDTHKATKIVNFAKDNPDKTVVKFCEEYSLTASKGYIREVLERTGSGILGGIEDDEENETDDQDELATDGESNERDDAPKFSTGDVISLEYDGEPTTAFVKYHIGRAAGSSNGHSYSVLLPRGTNASGWTYVSESKMVKIGEIDTDIDPKFWRGAMVDEWVEANDQPRAPEDDQEIATDGGVDVEDDDDAVVIAVESLMNTPDGQDEFGASYGRCDKCDRKIVVEDGCPECEPATDGGQDESNEQTAIEQLVDEIDGLNYYGVTISVTEFNNDGDITVSLYKDKSARDVKNTRIYYNDDTEQWRCVMGDDGYAVIDKALNKLNESGVVPADEAYEHATDGGVVTDDIESSDYIERALERAEAHERTGTVEFVGTSKDMDILSEVIEMGVKAYNEADNEPIDEDRFWGFEEALIDTMHELDGNEFYESNTNAEVWR